jgi:ADP-ribose pyrophosphatase
MKLATIRVKLSESDPEPKQKLDEGEHIVKRIVEVSELYNVLQGTFFLVSVLRKDGNGC